MVEKQKIYICADSKDGEIGNPFSGILCKNPEHCQNVGCQRLRELFLLNKNWDGLMLLREFKPVNSEIKPDNQQLTIDK